MAPTGKSFFLQFKPNLRVLVKFLFRWKRKPRPSSTTSIILPDSSVQDVSHSLSEKEYTFVVDFDPDMWRKILSYCEVVDIIHVSMACRSLASVTEDCRVWYSALLRISHNRRLPHLRFHIKSLSNTALRQKAILSAQLDRLPCGLHLIPSHYTTTRLSLLVSTVWGVSFLPGGEWLVVLCRKADEDGVMLCRANDPLGKFSTYSSVPDGDLTNMCVFTSDEGDLLMVLRSDCSNGTRLRVYLIHPSEGYPPRLEMVWTVGVQKIENFTAFGSYIVYGWIDRSHTEPRHLIKVLKFEPCYRKLAGYSTMKVGWEISKYSHSYALRILDSQITVVVSSKTSVAAYKAPPMVSASTLCEPTIAEPFWRFPCYMSPRAVYLAPSLPAVDTPSITIFYSDRCLFITPSFDTDPPGVHPTYVSTYRYPRELKYPMLLGPQRAFWDLGHGRVGIGTLPAPLQPAFCEHDSCDIVDIAGVNAPEADFADFVHPLVYAEYYNRRVARAAWDEESGKLALFPKSEFQRGENMSIIIVDFMHGVI